MLFTSLTGWMNALVTDPDGHPVSHGRERRWFSGPQRRAAQIAFPVCDHPSCTIRSPHCEVDHVLAWIDDGLTDTVNAKPMCKAHNLWKEHVTDRRRRRRPTP